MEDLKPSPANSSPLTPIGFLDRAATVYGDCPSVIYGSTAYTWSQTHRRCLQLASSLSSNGIHRGHVVSVVAPNTPAMYELQFAVPMAGAVLNNINLRLDAHTISMLLRHSESKLIFVDQASCSLINDALNLFPTKSKRPVLVLIADDVATEESSSPIFGDFVDTYEGMVEKGDPEFRWIRPLSEWDPIVLNYTSGTTSSPKGVVHCHRGIFMVTLDSLLEWGIPKQSVYLWTLPMAAVVARPDEFWGETPCAFVSLREGLSRRPTEEEIIEYCRGKLPRFMVPKTVVFKAELPKTSTGKIKKFVLREIAKSMGPARASRL
ncbi:probable acyl-activating enzyme 6 [Momordica charantia]|uniref:Probable acyl-activating enzyme 6 n=1 Tax=Momordica charantia TaxID=3673 RepID=A0A6J1CVP2_MOMCH|nr:probable acyl-activating enzyme 6 [Momordica charantia]